MSAKTKIVVLHMKELIYTGIFAALGILFIVLLVMMFLPGKKDEASQEGTEDKAPLQKEGAQEDSDVSSDSVYIPGIYTTELILGGQTVDVEVIVAETSITGLRLVNISETVTTMYPLLQPAFDSISQQIYETGSLEQVTYTAENKYTSLVLLEAIQSSLDKARPGTTPSASPGASASPAPSPTASPASVTNQGRTD